jgi:hypothetical protein
VILKLILKILCEGVEWIKLVRVNDRGGGFERNKKAGNLLRNSEIISF